MLKSECLTSQVMKNKVAGLLRRFPRKQSALLTWLLFL